MNMHMPPNEIVAAANAALSAGDMRNTFINEQPFVISSTPAVNIRIKSAADRPKAEQNTLSNMPLEDKRLAKTMKNTIAPHIPITAEKLSKIDCEMRDGMLGLASCFCAIEADAERMASVWRRSVRIRRTNALI